MDLTSAAQEIPSLSCLGKNKAPQETLALQLDLGLAATRCRVSRVPGLLLLGLAPPLSQLFFEGLQQHLPPPRAPADPMSWDWRRSASGLLVL